MFRLLSSQSMPIIIFVVLSVSMLALALIRLVVTHLAKEKKPLSISSPLPGIAATSFVFIAALLAAQIQGDISKARQAIYHEVSAIQMIRLHSEVLTPEQQAEISGLLQGYVNHVVTDEWKKMQYDGESSQARAYLSKLLRKIHQIRDSDAREAFRTASNDLISSRMERLRLAADTVPNVTWGILCCLALFTMLTLALNHGEHHQWQPVVGVTVAIMVALIFIMLLVHDQPYAREGIINPQVLIDALK